MRNKYEIAIFNILNQKRLELKTKFKQQNILKPAQYKKIVRKVEGRVP